jgi:magnesium transporter
MSSAEWEEKKALFDMPMDIELDLSDRTETRAFVSFDALTGGIFVPEREKPAAGGQFFAFALDEKGIAVIDDEGFALKLSEEIMRTRRWREPGLERFIYDLLEGVIEPDLRVLEDFKKKLDSMEERILSGEIEDLPAELSTTRGALNELQLFYEELIDLGQELEENENGFFRESGERYFRLFTDRVVRLQDRATSLRDHVGQLRELVQSQIDIRQNHIMTYLTVITSIFMPLTLITGWYGMNFRYMPELNYVWAYPAVLAVCVLIAAACIIWFKKKKWM